MKNFKRLDTNKKQFASDNESNDRSFQKKEKFNKYDDASKRLSKIIITRRQTFMDQNLPSGDLSKILTLLEKQLGLNQ